MKKRIVIFVAAFLPLFVHTLSFAADNAGYEVFSLNQRETISGKMLVIIAYAVIFGFLSLYAWSIARREQKVRKALRELKAVLQKPGQGTKELKGTVPNKLQPR